MNPQPPNPFNPHNETVEDGHAELMGADALTAIERGQIDVQISTAKKYPRSVKAFMTEAVGMISLSQDVAEGCNYKLKRRNKEGGMTIIEGPSIRLVEIAASAFGNLRYGSRTIAIDDEFVTAQGMAFDLEKNVASSVEVKRSIKSKHGRYSQDMIMVTANAAGAIARRNALNGIIPRVYIQTLADAAKKVALGDIKTLPERRQKAFDYFTKVLGVDLKLVLAYLEKPSVEDCTLDDVGELQALKTALKEGTTTAEEAFAPPSTGTTGQKPPLEPKPDPKPEPVKAKEPLPPLPSSGPSNPLPAKPKPAAAAPQPEPPKEEAPKPQPKEEPKTEPTKDPTPTTEPEPAPQAAAAETSPDLSLHNKIQAKLDERGVAWDDFTDWLVNSGRMREAKSLKEIAELPFDIAVAITANDGVVLNKCLKIFGTK